MTGKLTVQRQGYQHLWRDKVLLLNILTTLKSNPRTELVMHRATLPFWTTLVKQGHQVTMIHAAITAQSRTRIFTSDPKPQVRHTKIFVIFCNRLLRKIEKGWGALETYFESHHSLEPDKVK